MNASTCCTAPRWPDPEFPRKIPKNTLRAKILEPQENTPEIPKKNTQNGRFRYVGSIFLGIFGAVWGECLGVENFRLWGYFGFFFGTSGSGDLSAGAKRPKTHLETQQPDDNKISRQKKCTFRILLSWRFPRKKHFGRFYSLPPIPPPHNRKFDFYCRLAVSERGTKSTRKCNTPENVDFWTFSYALCSPLNLGAL